MRLRVCARIDISLNQLLMWLWNSIHM